MDHVKLAVNGTLMRGLPLEKNLLDAGAFFLREAATAPCYRLWSINDHNPAMLRVSPQPSALRWRCGRCPPPGWPRCW